MAKRTIELGDSPNVLVENVTGDLHVKGWKRNEVLLKTSCEGEMTFEQRGDQIYIDCPEDCIIYTPHSAILEINQVGGAAGFKALDGTVKINRVGRDLSLRDVGTVDTETVGSNLTARRIRGDLHIQTVGGNATARDVDGQFSCTGIGGGLRLSDISGGVTATAGGNARVDISPVPWQTYEITSGGNLRCSVPEDINAEISFASGARSIRIKFTDQSQTLKKPTHQQDFGGGGTPINLNAGGKVDLIGLSTEWDPDSDVGGEAFVDDDGDISNMVKDIARQTTEQLNAHLGVLDSHLSELSSTLEQAGLSEERTNEIQERLEQARQRATQRAEDAARRAQSKIERKLAAAQRKVARQSHRFQPKTVNVDIDALRTKAQGEPVSDDERMLILEMLQEGKVSVEQAEELLAALEGK